MIPNELKLLPQWVVWRVENRKGKPTKVPYDPKDVLDLYLLRHARTNDASTWGTYEEARAFCCEYQNRPHTWGVGFVFAADDPYCGIDIDHCVTWEGDTPSIPGTVGALVETFATYTEYSPSRTGVHLICRGELPGGKGRKFHYDRIGVNIELYDRGRFFTVTDDSWLLPCTAKDALIRNCQLEIEALLAEISPPPAPAPAPDDGSGEYTRWQDVNIHARADANPPIDLLMKLWENTNFRATFEHKRETKDGSPSSYDMALARIAATAGWPDQAIVDLIIYHRRAHEYDKLDRLDYYQRTIFNLRTDEKYQQALAKLDDLAQDAGMPGEPGEPGGPDEGTREVALAVIKRLTGLDIVRYIQYGMNPASYAIILKSQEHIVISTPALARAQGTWQDIVQEHTGVPFFALKPTQWQKFLRCLGLIREYEDNPDGNALDEFVEALRTYTRFAEEQTLQTVEDSLPYRDEQGHTYFTKAGFRNWLAQAHMDLPRVGIISSLKGAGARPTQVAMQRPDNTWVRKNYWRVDLE